MYGNINEEIILVKFRDLLSEYMSVGEVEKISDSVLELETCSKSFSYLLDKLGMKHISHNKSVPEFIWRSSREIQSAFLRGLFSSDGSCKKKGLNSTIRLVTTSEILAKEVQILLNSMGMNSSYGKNGSIYIKDGYDRKQSWQVYVRSDSRDTFLNKIGFLDNKSYTSLSNTVGSYTKNSVLEKIVSIEYIGLRECCGASVEGEVYTNVIIVIKKSQMIH